MRISYACALIALLSAAAPVAAQQAPTRDTQKVSLKAIDKVSLKDTQKAIRERILTEAGPDTLIYARVDFNDCAVTVQTRTPRRANGSETRTTTTFHATSLDPRMPDAATGGIVRLTTAAAAASLRLVVQQIDSGRVREAVLFDNDIEFRFVQAGTAATVARAFRHLVTLCLTNDRFRVGGQ